MRLPARLLAWLVHGLEPTEPVGSIIISHENKNRALASLLAFTLLCFVYQKTGSSPVQPIRSDESELIESSLFSFTFHSTGRFGFCFDCFRAVSSLLSAPAPLSRLIYRNYKQRQ